MNPLQEARPGLLHLGRHTNRKAGMGESLLLLDRLFRFLLYDALEFVRTGEGTGRIMLVL
jgi:hypothetical protein